MAIKDDGIEENVQNPLAPAPSKRWEDIVIDVSGTAPVPEYPANPIADVAVDEAPEPEVEEPVQQKQEVIEAPKETQAEVIAEEPEEIKAPEPEPEIVLTPKDTSRNDNPFTTLPSADEEKQKETKMLAETPEASEENVPNPVSFETANSTEPFDINAWWALPDAERNATLSDPRVQAALKAWDPQTHPQTPEVPTTAGPATPTDTRTAAEIAAQRRADESASSGLHGMYLQQRREQEQAIQNSIAASQTAEAEAQRQTMAQQYTADAAAQQRADEANANYLSDLITANREDQRRADAIAEAQREASIINSIRASQEPEVRADAEYRGNPLAWDQAAEIAARRRADEANANAQSNLAEANRIAAQRRADEANAIAQDNLAVANRIAAQRRADEANANELSALYESQRTAEELAAQRRADEANANYQDALAVANREEQRRRDAVAEAQRTAAANASIQASQTAEAEAQRLAIAQQQAAEIAARRRADEAAANGLAGQFIARQVAAENSIEASQTAEARADAEARTQPNPLTSSSWNQERFEETFNPTPEQIEFGQQARQQALDDIAYRTGLAEVNAEDQRRRDAMASVFGETGPAVPNPVNTTAETTAESGNPLATTPTTTPTTTPATTPHVYTYAENLDDMINWDGSRDFAEAISFWNHQLDEMGAREEFKDLLASDMNGSMGFGDMNGLGTNFYDFFFGTDDATGNKLKASPTETSNLTAEEFNEQLNDLITRSPAIGEWMNSVQEYLDAHPEMIQRLPPGINNAKDLFAYAFCKKPTGKAKKTGSGSGSGYGKYRSYGGGGGGYRGGGGYGGGSSSNASARNQNLNRVYNIMKNWSF